MVHDTSAVRPIRVTILMPLRDDWASAAELIRRLDRTFSECPCILDVLLVDDGSNQRHVTADFQSSFAVVKSIGILRLRRNLGHQRAIAIGIAYCNQAMQGDAVLVMDADGEDTPEGALQLVNEFAGSAQCAKAIFAERSRRTESFTFQVSYRFYKILHRALTGIRVRVGNFSIFPSSYLSTLVVMSELWNHYAAAVFRSGLSFTATPIPRGYRIAGNSKMNFVSLVAHGMSAMSVFADLVGVRLVIASVAGSLLAVAGILTVVAIRLFSNLAIPGWATYTAGILVVILIQCFTIATSFAFQMLSNRTTLSFVPLRDHALFVLEKLEVYPGE